MSGGEYVSLGYFERDDLAAVTHTARRIDDDFQDLVVDQGLRMLYCVA